MDERDRLRWASLLHDIGKLEVGAKILNKDGPLSSDEWTVMHQHPEIGARVTAPLQEWLGEWIHAVDQHHENYDGTGYPHGLSADEISIGARIVAVADAFEVMTALRSYKRPMDAAAARQELARCSGAQFDPVVVRVFLNLSLGRIAWLVGPIAWLTSLRLVQAASNLRPAISLTLRSAFLVGTTVAVAALVVTPGRAGYQAEADPPSQHRPAIGVGLAALHEADAVAVPVLAPAVPAGPAPEEEARGVSTSTAPAAGPVRRSAPAPRPTPDTAPHTATPAPAAAPPPTASPPADDPVRPAKPPTSPTPVIAPKPDDRLKAIGGNSIAAHDHSHDVECGSHGAWVAANAHHEDAC